MRGHFEAKKHGFRQTQDGVVVSFVMHPNDVNGDFAAAPLGTIFVIGYATPEEGGDAPSSPSSSGASNVAPVAEQSASSGGASKQDKTVQRCAILCADQQFQEWLWREVAKDLPWPDGIVTLPNMSPDGWESWTIVELRNRLNIISRRDLATNDIARRKFLALEDQFLVATGRRAECRG